MQKTQSVVLLSGGMDSTVLLHRQVQLLGKEHVHALSVRYGQRHQKEVQFAAKTCTKRDVTWSQLFIPMAYTGNSQTDARVEVPDGHYTDESMRITVVPNRNMIMLAHATAFAISLECTQLAYAAHSGDHAIYPDCRPEFIRGMADAIYLSHFEERAVELLAPFQNLTKRDIALMGRDLHVDFNDTWSCYKGLSHHCGTCGTCVERREALQGFDPTEYVNEMPL
jgi:7-cyano-7-deazaguanine synthase